MQKRGFLKLSLYGTLSLIFSTLMGERVKAADISKVNIQGFRFSPKKVTVKVKTSIEFINLDSAPHTATASDGSWDTGTLNYYDKAVVNITKEMKTDYYCEYHPNMKGSLIVDT